MNIRRTIKFEPEHRKKDGEKLVKNIPIRMIVRYCSNRIDFTTGFRVDVDKWDFENQIVKKNTINKNKESASYINSELQKYENIIEDIFKSYEVKEVIPTTSEIKEAFNLKLNPNSTTKSKEKIKSIWVTFDEFINESRKMRNWTDSTYTKFLTVKKHLQQFNSKLSFDTFTEEGLNDYVEFLRETLSMCNTTISKQLGYLKWFLRWGVKKGYNTNKAFELFKPNQKNTAKKVIFLSKSELKKLKDAHLPENKNYLERVRDVFLFSCYTGLRYSDVYNLKVSDIKKDYIEITTIKTADSLRIDLNTESRAILAKYKGIVFENAKALPVISNQRMNTYLKELCQIAGIDEQVRITTYRGNQRIDKVYFKYELIGTHAARRTFISLALSMGIPPQVVMKWTGHSDYKAMKPYVDIADEVKTEQMKKFDRLL